MDITYTTRSQRTRGTLPGRFLRATANNWETFRDHAKALDLEMNELINVCNQLLNNFTTNKEVNNNGK